MLQPDIQRENIKRFKALDNAFVQNFYDSKNLTGTVTNATSDYTLLKGSIAEVHIDYINSSWNGTNNDVKVQIEINAIDPDNEDFWLPVGNGISLKDALSLNVNPFESVSLPPGIYVRLAARVQVSQIDETAQGYVTAYLILK